MCAFAFVQDSGIDLGPGLYFADGKKKVDYVLCYKYKKRRASRGRLSIASNGSIPIPIPSRWETEVESAEAGAPAGDVEESKLSEEEKALMREEFEVGLQEAGLELERDKQVCVCFCGAFTVIIFSSAVHSNRHLWARAVLK